MTLRALGSFVVVNEVGRGGMGVVYAATDERDGTKVAVKVLMKGAAGSSPEALARFDREIVALGSLDHPAIVCYRGHGLTEEGEPYLAMEWIEGEDLSVRLARGPLSLAETITLGAALAGALAAVHARGLVHRDLKPSNVLLREGDVGRPILVDFGIARSAHAQTLTRTGVALGTPQYMAPEQVQGGTVDARTDLFALGLMLHECVTGRPVFDGEHVMAVIAKVLVGQAPSLADHGIAAPAAFEATLASLLAKEPAERPKTAADVALALEACAHEVESQHGGTAVAAGQRRRLLTAGERRLVAVVLAADARAQAALDATITPEQADGLSSELGAMVRAQGGELSSLGGQRFLVVFPSAGVATDQARRAARCALAVASIWPTARVALALGWAEVGTLPVGEVIDRAAALLEADSPARVRADEATAALLEVHFQTALRGATFEVIGERRVEERPRTLLGKPTRFVGRDREVGSLLASLDEVVDEEVARAVLVTAVSGAGKSRLRHEFLERLAARDVPMAVLEARAEELRAGSPLDVVATLVRAWAGAQGADPATLRDALRARVSQRCSEAERVDVAEFLGELAGAPFPSESSARLAAARADARLLGEQMQRAFVAMLKAESAARPLLIVIEDLHWADPQSVRFLDAALRDAADRPWLLLAFTRPDVHERFPGLWKPRGVSEIALGPLTRRACERLVTDVLGDVEPEMLERIVRHADGNALYLEELIRAASEGSLNDLPESVLAMVQARLEAFDAAMRRALRAGSVFGELFHHTAVHALAGGTAADVDATLDRLVDAEVLQRGDAGRFAFRHAAVRDAAYAMLTDQDRKLGHGLAARWLEGAGEQDARLLAQHWDSAGDAANAARWYAHAARQALGKNDFEATLVLGARALELEDEGEVRAEACFARGSAMSAMGRLIEAVTELEAALAAMSPSDDEQRLMALRVLWNVGLYRQQAATLRRAGDEALVLARRLGRSDLVAEARCALAVADHCEERCDVSIEGYRDAYGAKGESPSVVFGLSSIILYHAGQYEEVVRVGGEMLPRAYDLRDWNSTVTLETNIGAALAGLGRYEEARARFATARALGEQVGMPMVTARAIAISVGHHLDVLDLDGARRVADDACEVGKALEFSTPRISAMLDLGFIATARGDAAEAERIADSLKTPVTNGTGFHGWLWRARMEVLRAEIAVLAGRHAEALPIAERALATWTRLRREKYVALAEVVRARALAGLGRADEASAALSTLLHERLTLPDPAMRLRVASLLWKIGHEEKARGVALESAATIERALPASSQPAFRASADVLLR